MKISIVGAGISGLFCAYHLVKSGIEVDLYEKEKTIAKKFLIAGKSGLNITSNYPLHKFDKMYFDQSDIFKELLKDFAPKDTIEWLAELGFMTFEGSSYKVFPKEFKAASLLKTIKDYLLASPFFQLHTSKELIDFDCELLIFKDEKINYDKAIFALGGGSWASTGSDAKWLDTFLAKGVSCNPIKPSNCGFKTDISLDTRIPLKNINISFDGHKVKGEALIYNNAIEGGAIYHLSSFIRETILTNNCATIHIDFKPAVSEEDLLMKLKYKKNKVSWANHVKKTLNLDNEVFNLFKSEMTKEEYFDPTFVANFIKKFPLKLNHFNEIDKAISTSGGVKFDSLNSNFELHKFPKICISGEMLDWEAPTGGFLIQGCYSISHRIITHIVSENKK